MGNRTVQVQNNRLIRCRHVDVKFTEQGPQDQVQLSLGHEGVWLG